MPANRPSDSLPQLPRAMQTESDYQWCASRLKALADADRLQIVNSLLQSDKSVSELAEELGATIDKVSHHLGVLRSARLVQTQRQGKFIIYSVTPEIAATSRKGDKTKQIDLGCCQLDILQPKSLTKTTGKNASSKNG